MEMPLGLLLVLLLDSPLVLSMASLLDYSLGPELASSMVKLLVLHLGKRLE